MPKMLRLLLVLLTVIVATRADAAERPNVVLVMTDDQGYGDVGIHGNDVIRTPHLDRFAREGVRLTRFYCSPVCAPTRAGLMTGRYYYRTGVIHTSRGGAKMHGDEVTIAERLRAAGYRTGIFGKWHLGDNFPMRPQDQGFDEVLVHKSGGIGQSPDQPNSYTDPRLWHHGRPVRADGYCTDVFFEAALDFIAEHRAKHRERPFFVYLATNAPHTPLEVPARYSEPYRRQGLNETTARVYGMVENIDENFGRLLARLGELRLRERTLIVFLTDNGPQQRRYTAGLRGRKSQVYEGGIRVPCFVQWPGHWPGGRTIDTPAADIDWLPTLLDACGIDAAETVTEKHRLDGRSLVPLLSGADAELSDSDGHRDRKLFFQCHRGLHPQPLQNAVVVTRRFKLVAHPGTFGQEDFQVPAEPRLELYDLLADPGETRDIAADHPKRVAELRAAYERWFADVRQSRKFEPGRIVVGSPAENPIHLCRYQDGQYEGGRSQGWPVEIVRGGRYRVRVTRSDAERDADDGRIGIRWQGETRYQPVGADGTAVFELAAARGLLDVWFEPIAGRRAWPTENNPLGDATLERLSKASP